MTIIELTDYSDGKSVYVVCEHIASFESKNAPTKHTRIISTGGIIATVKETPREIIALIHDAMGE
jgi:hypothetical protein